MKRARKWRTAKPPKFRPTGLAKLIIDDADRARQFRMVRRALAMPGVEFVEPVAGTIQTAPSEKHWAVEHCSFTDEHGKTTRYTRKLT